ncbi:MAG: toxin-antitoxin system YwqK family antitoxin [Winogradskyella sp.]|uniref:toxin-antitoxin system YwqK family antitoxin n=1 Tax=Winogradskyella sp. TaxID=1883156 RepID=UPI000F3ED7C7|nr:toxin-antitoxin system YwqK family antitoxin [Winogradskyella sp.]RNC86831.1 MAG: toxin-antitoxin system YwqK family antitoxin [Winogradskyella sp.]
MIKHKFLFAFFLTVILTSLDAQVSVNKFDESGERHGIWQKNYPNTNQLRYKGQFEHGKEIDTFKFYKLKQKRSVLSAIKVFNPNNNKAEVSFLASNGSVISKGIMDGKKFIGKWLFYHKNSTTIMTEETYNATGQLEGTRKVYFTSGTIAETSEYQNGKRDGVTKTYSESAKLLQESNYKEDKLNGESLYYDASGNMEAKGNYNANLKTGIWEYYKNGELTKKVDHNNDKVIFKKQ